MPGEGRMPVGIRRIRGHAPVVIGRAIGPPHRAAFAEAALGLVDERTGAASGVTG